MPKDEGTGLIEPDITVNGRALTFAECMAVRVAIGSFRLLLSDPKYQGGVGRQLAGNYDHHLAHVEHHMRAFGPEGRGDVPTRFDPPLDSRALGDEALKRK